MTDRPVPTASRTGSRTDVSVYEPLCPECRLPLDFAQRMGMAEQRDLTRSLWQCAACGLPAWGRDWDDAP